MSPNPFPTTAADWALRQVGAIGAWEGDAAVPPEELAAAQPSVLSQVIAGERMNLRPRCEACGSVLLRDGANGSWCATCESLGAEPSRHDDERPELDAHGLAALPVSDEVMRAHEELVRKTYREEVGEFEIELGFNPQTGAFDAMMRGEVMQLLRELGPGVRIKGRF